MNTETLWCAFHVDAPKESQSQNETEYPHYERQSIDGFGWVFTNGAFANRVPLTFPNPSRHGIRVTHFSLGTAKEGPGHIRVVGPLNVKAKRQQETVEFAPGTLRIDIQRPSTR